MTVSASSVRKLTDVTITMDAETAELLQALIYQSLNLSRAPWAHEIADALSAVGVTSTGEQDDEVREEVQRFIDSTEPLRGGCDDVAVIDVGEDEDGELIDSDY